MQFGGSSATEAARSNRLQCRHSSAANRRPAAIGRKMPTGDRGHRQHGQRWSATDDRQFHPLLAANEENSLENPTHCRLIPAH